ncbi:MAG: PrsW family intramembrane metalloprotease [Eubacteriales bacterium]|nr:PrsW family intramembrane metalloprotease [Eubacteriales bacterium]
MFFYANPILIAAAVIPAIVLLRYIYKKDALEKEPKRLLISLVARGVIATFLAMITEGAGDWILSGFVPQGTVAYNALMYFVVVAFSEEGFKYLMLRHRTWNSPDFNCSFDGVVYAVFVSLGFALWENISYVSAYGLGTAAVRALTAVPGHACFGVFMGSWYGMARWYENFGDTEKSKHYRRKALFVPALLHGCYDFIATIDNSLFAMIFLVFIAFMFSSAHRTVRKLSHDDRYIDSNGYFTL